MATSATQQCKRDPNDGAGSAGFLSKLEAAHVELETCLAALDGVMASPELSEPTRFSVVRLRLAKANLARTQLAREACGHLIQRVTGCGGALRDLQQREMDHAQAVSNHVRQWTPNLVKDDWEGYCHATRRLLERVRELIVSERDLLLPQLRRAS
jgi:hypothetical protein